MPPQIPANIAIVDEHVLFRRIIKDYLTDQGNIQVVIQASDVSELLNKLKGMDVDVLLMNILRPEVNGSDIIKMIRSEYPDIKMLVLSVTTDLDLVSELLDSGIYGYIAKSATPEDLLQAVQTISNGNIYRNKLFTEALYWNKQNDLRSYAYISDASPVLSDREKRILQLIWEEKSNKEIADDLFLGVKSVEKIRQDMKEKIGAKSTIGMLKYAISQKIVPQRECGQYALNCARS